MKEYDDKWTSYDGTQDLYENIIVKAIEKDIKILGVSFESLGSEEYSPSQSENFRNNKIKNAKKISFRSFNNFIFSKRLYDRKKRNRFRPN